MAGVPLMICFEFCKIFLSPHQHLRGAFLSAFENLRLVLEPGLESTPQVFDCPTADPLLNETPLKCKTSQSNAKFAVFCAQRSNVGRRCCKLATSFG